MARTLLELMDGVLAPRTGQMSARTNTLLSQPETGKIAASIISVVAGWHPAQAPDNARMII
jgi:hypothetical protein